MTITITFTEPLTTLLEQEAARLQVSVDELATTLLNKALLVQDIEDADATDDPTTTTLEQIVARIKALPPNPQSFRPAIRAHDKEYLDYLLANPPKDTMTLEEWERFWPAFEQELKMIDRMDDIAEGRI
jgi:hypothetical protein